MTDEELNAIEARANAATPGPWLTPKEAGDPYKVDIVDHEGCQVWPWGGIMDEDQGEKDMIFAYAARTDVPELIAEIRWLRVQLEELETTLETERESAQYDYDR